MILLTYVCTQLRSLRYWSGHDPVDLRTHAASLKYWSGPWPTSSAALMRLAAVFAMRHACAVSEPAARLWHVWGILLAVIARYCWFPWLITSSSCPYARLSICQEIFPIDWNRACLRLCQHSLKSVAYSEWWSWSTTHCIIANLHCLLTVNF